MIVCKRPVEVEAIQLRQVKVDEDVIPGLTDFFFETPDWINTSDTKIEFHIGPSNWECWINTLEGDMRAEPGDWIIRGIKGELYPCKPEIFEATYDVVMKS